MASSYNEWPINKDLVGVELIKHHTDCYAYGQAVGRSGQHREVRKSLLPEEVQWYFPKHQGGAVTRWDVFKPYTMSDNMVFVSSLPDGILVAELGCTHEYHTEQPHFNAVTIYHCTLCGHRYEIDHGD